MAGGHEQNTPSDPGASSGKRQTYTGRAAAAAPERVRYEPEPKQKSGILAWAIPVIVVLVLVVGALAAAMVYASRIAALDTIYPNITVSGVDVSGMTVDEAVRALETSDAAPDTRASVTARLPMDKTLTVTTGELGVTVDARPAAEAAYAYGRGGSMLDNLRAYRACRKTPVALTWEAPEDVDEEKLRGLVESAVNEVNALLLGSDADIGEEGVTVVKGMNAEKLDAEAIYESMLQAFRTKTYDDITVELKIRSDADENRYAVLETVYDAIYVEPKDAEYDKNTGGVSESVRGVSFDMDEAKKLWDEAEAGDEVYIPFIFTEPAVDSEKLANGLFADLLSEKSTSLSGSSSNRINNITLTAQAVNEVVLEPGETFDYNAIVGERTTARGYKEAGAYSGGKHVNQVGGGICQTSSTIYYCAMYANLRITTRSCHYFVVSYLPRGFDATVSWGGPDFRFVNSRDYPIKIKAWVSGGYLTVQIWGTDDGTRVEMTSETWEDSVYYYAQTYRTVYAADGTQISSEKEAYSSYHKYEETGETPVPETNTTPEPDPTPESVPEVTTAPEPTSAPEPDPTPIPEPETTPAPAPEPEPTPAPEPEPGPQTEPDPGPQTEPDPGPWTEPDPGPGAEPGPGDGPGE